MSSFLTLAALLRDDRRAAAVLKRGLMVDVLVVAVLAGFNVLDAI